VKVHIRYEFLQSASKQLSGKHTRAQHLPSRPLARAATTASLVAATQGRSSMFPLTWVNSASLLAFFRLPPGPGSSGRSDGSSEAGEMSLLRERFAITCLHVLSLKASNLLKEKYMHECKPLGHAAAENSRRYFSSCFTKGRIVTTSTIASVYEGY